MKLYIKNMACESCKVVVKEELEAIGANPVKVELGEAEVKQALSEKKQKEFASAIKKAGLELVQSKEGIMADKIKAAIADYIAHKKSIRVNMSDYLSRKLKMDYSYLSSYFSAMQASTVEQYAISLRIEKVKELLVLEGLTLTEIAKKLDYSSVSHLSKQFRQVTGLAASHFKKLRLVRSTIQSL
ncbi:MAG: AraC family transcriptional regulator [Bacteroidota bacterium]|nr:AraC family transcriptional regulator [Bacteroidota bacterium]